MVQDILAFSVLPLVVAAAGAVYGVKLVDRAENVGFTAFVLFFLMLGGYEALGLWQLLTSEGAGPSSGVAEWVQTGVAVTALASVLVAGRSLEAGEEGRREVKQELKDVRAKLHDETERRRGLEERAEELAVYDEMVSSVPDMLFAVDESGGFVETNDAMQALLGFDDGELLEMGFHDVMAAEKAGDLTVESEEQRVLVEHEVRTKDGDSFPVELHMARLTGDTGVTKGIVGMARDIRERKEREQRLDVLNRFFRHNVRNELTVVSGSAELLVDQLSGEEKRYAERIRERARVLEEMSDKARKIGSILDGRPEPRSYDVDEVVRDAVAEFDEEVVDLDVTVSEDLAVRSVEGIEFALRNLVENAVEHPGRERPHVEVRAFGDDSDVRIEVHDDGDGIPKQEVETISDASENPLQHGSGIGLWAVKWIVDRSEGEVEFGDSPLGGAAVSIVLNSA